MFAVVRTGGKQYRVHPGDKIVVEKLDGNAGDKITLGEVLLAGDAGNLKSTDGLTVAAEIVAQAKGEKVTVFKKRRRHNYRRKKGHRQQHTILKIVAIGDHKAEKKAAPKAEAAAPAKGKKAEAAEAPKVDTKETPNPAPQEEAKANPPAESADAPTKTGGKKSAAGGKAAKAASTENAAPAKGAAKKSSKAK
ncbi:MAG TPA: 50S ribosomal protein L21 [Sphingomicrobium sp.]